MPNDSGFEEQQPRRDTRFQKGQSGNPKGRPKGSKNLETIFREVTEELTSITENGKRKQVQKMEAAFRHIMVKAMSGNLSAYKLVLLSRQSSEGAGQQEEMDSSDREKASITVARFLQRYNATTEIPQEATPDLGEKPNEL